MQLPLYEKGITTKPWVVLLLLTVTTWAGCVRKETLYRKPADVSSAKTCVLAVLKFHGPHGETVRNHVHDALAKIQGFTPIATAGDPRLDKLAYEQEHDPDIFLALEALGADAAIAGRVTVSVADVPGTDTVQVEEGTGHYKQERDAYGHWVDVEIKRTVIRGLPYVIRKASITMAYKVLDIKTKRLVVAKKLTESREEKFGGDEEYASLDHRLSDLPPQGSTMDELSGTLATSLIARLAQTKLTNPGKCLRLLKAN